MTRFTATASMSRMLIVGLVLVAGALAPVVPAEASAGSAQGITATSRADRTDWSARAVRCQVRQLCQWPPRPQVHICLVIDSDSRFSSLAAAVAQAAPGDSLDVVGTCVGSTTIDKDLSVE